MSERPRSLGLSGHLTRLTLEEPLTLLFLLAALFLGLFALMTIAREEEPQISVPMVDVFVTANGLKAPDALELIAKPLEEIVKSIDGVEHVYSQTQDDQVLVTARFLTGTNEDDAVLRVHEKIRGNYDRMPLGIPEPLIVKRGINDVAVVVLTLSPKAAVADRWDAEALYNLADKVQKEMIKVDNIGLTYLVGSGREEISIEPDLEQLNLFGVTLNQLVAKVRGANRSFVSGLVRDRAEMGALVSGQTLTGIPDIGLLLITTRDGRPVYLRDVATVRVGSSAAEKRVWNFVPTKERGWEKVPAVSVAIAKRSGANAVVVAEDVLKRVEALKKTLIPDNVRVDVTRNYGQTANDKANELLFHLALATVSIIALIAFAIGRREALVTAVVIPTTILLTLFASKLMGYTINRVSLFALIFSIGILVDDAIVMIENIARHWAMNDGRSRRQAVIEAVSEVGNPTIMATLTVVAALLPMMFVSGMMGPYMAPIPVNASAAMLFSFFIAVTIAPWLLLKLAKRSKRQEGEDEDALEDEEEGEGWLGGWYRRLAERVVRTRARARKFLITIAVVTVLCCGLFLTRSVTVKLLPFDNKSELSVMLDLPRGASVEDTERALFALMRDVGEVPEVALVQAYAGTAAPFNFNGLVRHSYLRQMPEFGELQISLLDKSDRSRSSHEIALDLRERLKKTVLRDGAIVKVVEVPPGPPVMATLLAEVYGPNATTRRAMAEAVKTLFGQVPYVVDVDDSYGLMRPRLRLSIDQDQLEFLGVEQADVYSTVGALFGGVPVGYSHRGEDRSPLRIVMRLPKSGLAWTQQTASTPVPANALPGNRSIVELGEVVHALREKGSTVVFRHNGYAVDMVMAELAGAYEAPIYAMRDIGKLIRKHDWGEAEAPDVLLHGPPEDETHPSLLWDGEWEITYTTFRDMGGAFAVALLAIYMLVVGQFRNFLVPLIVLTPVPLTLIGVILGHWLFGAAFTATSMIGFIALAGIVVRNSILLVDFIRQEAGQGKTLRDVLLDAGAVRFRPIVLTALAAMIGAATILADPIFQGLALSLLFGLGAATFLTVLVIPALYVVLNDADAVWEKRP